MEQDTSSPKLPEQRARAVHPRLADGSETHVRKAHAVRNVISARQQKCRNRRRAFLHSVYGRGRTDDDDGAVRFVRDGFGNAAQREPLPSSASMGTQ
jgi:hypothetical protein